MKKYLIVLFLSCWFGELYSQSSVWNLISGYSIINTDTMFTKKIDGNFVWSLQIKADTLSDTTSFSIYHSDNGQLYNLYGTKTISSVNMAIDTINGDSTFYYIFTDDYFASEYIGLRIQNDSATTGTVRARLVLKK